MDAPATARHAMQHADGERAGCASMGRSRTGASNTVVLFSAKVGSRDGYTKIR